jgi:hypothetical protein
MCLPSRCLATKVYSDSTILAFGCYVTVMLAIWTLLNNGNIINSLHLYRNTEEHLLILMCGRDFSFGSQWYVVLRRAILWMRDLYDGFLLQFISSVRNLLYPIPRSLFVQ